MLVALSAGRVPQTVTTKRIEPFQVLLQCNPGKAHSADLILHVINGNFVILLFTCHTAAEDNVIVPMMTENL